MTRLPIPVIRPGSPAEFPAPETALPEPNGLLAVGGDLSPQRLLTAYAQGIFPWYSEGEPILWWSPDPRCVFDTGNVHVSRSLRQQLRRSNWTLTADHAFLDVISACAAPREDHDGTWLLAGMIKAYCRLHDLGHAHSVEVWDGNTLVGGIYGLAIGRMFCGESMFSHAGGGSKIALLALARTLHAWGYPLLDAQVPNPHLFSLGARLLPRRQYLEQLASLMHAAQPAGSWCSRWPICQVNELV